MGGHVELMRTVGFVCAGWSETGLGGGAKGAPREAEGGKALRWYGKKDSVPVVQSELAWADDWLRGFHAM